MSLSSTYSDLVSMSLSGVNNLSSPPSQISTAIFPCKFIVYSGSNFEITSLASNLGLRNHQFDVIVLIDAYSQNTQDNINTLMISISESMYSAFDTIAAIQTITIEPKSLNVGNSSVFALVARVTVLE